MLTPVTLPLGLRILRSIPLPRKLGLLERLFGARLFTYGCNWFRCANGVVWKLDLREVTHRWIAYGRYEGGLGVGFAQKRLANGGVFVDSGANIGQWLLYLGHIDGLRAFEFEPVQANRESLAASINMQVGWPSVCEVFPFGLGSSDAVVEIQCDGPRSTTRMDWFKDRRLTVESIRLVRLDDVMDASGVDVVDFWKLDVEGAEVEALRGARDLIREKRVRALYFECIPENYSGCRELLEEGGYALFLLRKHGLVRLECERIACTQDIVALPL